ncbi:PF07588 domain protein [Leptospira kirschneri serovar Bulgarica str. Nikolaevo]|uniref:PF07588 domain protein n=1 Tax=Leptospira kirschneri serovar Bulgarica str. Nikolaevo TaxID=1240687 RepID=M6F6M7_9LEPT|nr:PF07588 domain protein [Leptospira kirschneri serovar Bulgarica str. Nikolaevo]
MAANGTREAVFVGDGSPRFVDWVLYPNKQYRRSDGTTITFTTNVNSVVDVNLQNSVNGGAEKLYWGLGLEVNQQPLIGK